MWQPISTEAAGWREALSDRATVLTLLVRVVAAALCALVGAVGAGITNAPTAVLGTALGVLLGSLALLRARGRV